MIVDRIKAATIILFLTMPAIALTAEVGQWLVEKSTLTYKVDHPLHGAMGTSHSARGKIVCNGTGCRFLVAAPVNSFDSGDSNRDLEMVLAVRAVKFPMVVVKGALTSEPQGKELITDVDVEFAGEKHLYKDVKLGINSGISGTDSLRVTGTIPLNLKDFKIQPPSLLGMPIKNDVPVKVDMLWRKTPVKS